jgi:catechol 2,3-dioxygenase-like lactoylglutathione lyase family enzyme
VLQHVTVEVPRDRVEACVDFWTLLGFSRVEPPPSLSGRAVWMEREGTQVHLMHVDDPVIPPTGHAAVLVEDYGGAFRALQDAGHDPEPRSEHWGSPRCFVHDPAGHRVEVMASSPARR